MSKAYYAQHLSAGRLDRVYEIAGPRVRQYLRAEIDHLTSDIRPGERVLELGCGTGRVLSRLAEKAGSGWGVDNALASVSLARAVHREWHLAVMDAAHLGFTDGCFDRVVGVQNFISACKVSPEILLDECLRVTRSGGRVVLSSYASQFWAHRLDWFRAQSTEGLLGPIDETATGNGVIVCTDGFRATTFSRKDFTALAGTLKIAADIYLVDDSSVFCSIAVP